MLRKNKRRYTGDVCRVPYDLALCGHIFGIQKRRIPDFADCWTAQNGNQFSLRERESLGARDLVHYLALLHIMQHPGIYNVEQDVYSCDKYRMVVPAKALYDFLQIPASGSGRTDLRYSIGLLATTELDVLYPNGDSCMYIGLGLQAGKIEFRGAGSGGSKVILTPDRRLIDTSGITENISRILSYHFGLTKIIDYQVAARLDGGLCLDRAAWRNMCSHGSRIDNFNRQFDEALREFQQERLFIQLPQQDGRIFIKMGRQSSK